MPGNDEIETEMDDGGAAARAAGRHAKPTWAQIRYLIRGIKEPGGKLPLFDDEGQEIDIRTIRSCVARGWAEPWFANPIKPTWLVCRLTPSGYKILGVEKSS
jgi:hypothetical protein